LGFSDGSAPLYNQTATIGFGHLVNEQQDGFGLGLNWGSPSDDTLRDQVTIEALYNFQFSENLEITPSVQYLIDPALNPDESALLLFGLRVRLTL
jgi:porin